MPNSEPQLTAYDRTASVWNELMDIRSTLPLEDFTSLTAVLTLLDKVLIDLDPGTCPQPVPIYYRDCQCKTLHDG